jgi:hypothetical protein
LLPVNQPANQPIGQPVHSGLTGELKAR